MVLMKAPKNSRTGGDEKMDQKRAGAFIAAMRKGKGFIQAELAEKLGVTDKSVSKWECGRCLPDASLMQPLCQAPGVSLSGLFAGEQLDAVRTCQVGQRA